MIELHVSSELLENDEIKIRFKGKCEGNRELLVREIAEVLARFDELQDGEILCDAFDVFLSKQIEEHNKHVCELRNEGRKHER